MNSPSLHTRLMAAFTARTASAGVGSVARQNRAVADSRAIISAAVTPLPATSPIATASRSPVSRT